MYESWAGGRQRNVGRESATQSVFSVQESKEVPTRDSKKWNKTKGREILGALRRRKKITSLPVILHHLNVYGASRNKTDTQRVESLYRRLPAEWREKCRWRLTIPSNFSFMKDVKCYITFMIYLFMYLYTYLFICLFTVNDTQRWLITVTSLWKKNLPSQRRNQSLYRTAFISLRLKDFS